VEVKPVEKQDVATHVEVEVGKLEEEWKAVKTQV